MKILSLIFALMISTSVIAKVTFKVAVIAPEGTSWADGLKNMAKEIKAATNEEVELKIYFGGSQGEEAVVLRKIRVGQLQGGVFTGKTLGEINGDVRVIELPFTFKHDRARAFGVLEKMAPFLTQRFEKENFQNMGFFELGQVYLGMKKKVTQLKDLNGVRIWAWEGDKLVSAFMDIMKLVSVPLPLQDVLSSLSTGVLEGTYGPPLGIIALQWNTKIKYLLDYPVTYSVGAFVLDKKQWAKVPEKLQSVVKEICTKNLKAISIANAKENEDSIRVMQNMGVEMVSFSEADYKELEQARVKMIAQLKGSVFTQEALTKLDAAMK